MTLILPDLTFNNAFTSPIFLGYEPFAVVPTYQTIDAFSLEMGLPSDAGTIACHELTHYVHFQQVAGFAWLVDAVVRRVSTRRRSASTAGSTRGSPSTTRRRCSRASDGWPGRSGTAPSPPAWRADGCRAAISPSSTATPSWATTTWSAATSSASWPSATASGRSGRRSRCRPVRSSFRSGSTSGSGRRTARRLETLFAEFADDVARRHPAVARPPEQRTLEKVGAIARYGRAADGSEALIVEGHDTPPRIVVRGPDGRGARRSQPHRRRRRRARWWRPAPTARGRPASPPTGGSSTSPRSTRGVTFERSRLMRARRRDRRADRRRRATSTAAAARSAPTGRPTPSSRADGDRHNLVLLDVASGSLRVLAAQPPGAFVSLPRYAPDGQRIVATVFDGTSFSIRVFDAAHRRGAGPGHRRARGGARRLLGRRHARRLPALGRPRGRIPGLPGRSRAADSRARSPTRPTWRSSHRWPAGRCGSSTATAGAGRSTSSR